MYSFWHFSEEPSHVKFDFISAIRLVEQTIDIPIHVAHLSIEGWIPAKTLREERYVVIVQVEIVDGVLNMLPSVADFCLNKLSLLIVAWMLLRFCCEFPSPW